MPRPHIPTHISLQRIKSSGSTPKSNTTTPQASSAPLTPPTNHSRGESPTRGDYFPANKAMGLTLRVEVLKGQNLAAKDKSGTSDPYLVLTLGDSKQATSVVNKTLNPEWNQTFEFPVSSPDAALLEVICWDKDRFRKDYMGESDVVLEDLFQDGIVMPEPRWLKLESRRSGRRKKKDQNVTGELLMKFTLYDASNTAATSQQILSRFYGLVGETPGTEDESEDDLNRLTSRGLDDVSEEDNDEDDDDDKGQSAEDTDDKTPGGTVDERAKRRRQKKLAKLRRKKKLRAYEFSGASDVAGVLFLEINRITDLPPEKNSTRTTFDMDPFVVTSLGKKTYRTRVVNHNLNPVYDEKLVFQVSKHEVNYSLNFAVVDRDKFSGNDFVGTTSMPLSNVQDKAPEADSETGLYRLPDPDTLVEHETDKQTKKKRWPMSRTTSQNNLSRNTSANNLHKLTRTASSNSLKGEQTSTPAATPAPRPGLKRMPTDSDLDYLSAGNSNQRPPPTSAPSYTSVMPNAESGAAQNGATAVEDPDLIAFELPLELKNKQRWQDKHHPVLYLKAKYLPYRALRQQFWRAMLKQYDADESGKIDKVELTTMLDTLGSTLHNTTIDGFFERWAETNKTNGVPTKDGSSVLTVDQAVICLEEQLMKTQDAQSRLHRPHWARGPSTKSTLSTTVTSDSASSPDESPGGTTPYLAGIDSTRHPQQAARLPGGAPKAQNLTTDAIPSFEVSDISESSEQDPTTPGVSSQPTTPGANTLYSGISRTDSWGEQSEAELNDDPETKEEHVVEIHECPICHMPRLAGNRRRKTTDADIITHIATCASSDWRAVNNLVMAGFVTSSQAQRKWYTKVVAKIGYGGYKLGANSANILVQDRITGMINEERMSVYVRLGIRLLYKGLKSREMEKKRIRKLLRSMSFKQGRKYDDPASAAQIPGFINFHQLDMTEVLLPTEEFKTFNEFFYRKLKPDARPCSAPDNPHIIVSPADCRSVVFNRMEDAQRIWVKGREFSIDRLLSGAYPEDAKRYKNGALGIMRLAPQDYHRFHIPVDGIMGEPRLIEGEYYTVNPMAIRSALDVYGENIRVCVPIDSQVHGRVMVVCVGAMMVGSTVITRKPGEEVRRAEELGYFKFGGSTLLLLFEPGVMQFDDDLAGNSSDALETLIRVGMSIGHSPTHERHRPDMPKENPTAAEKQEATRRIQGSIDLSSGMIDTLPMSAPI